MTDDRDGQHDAGDWLAAQFGSHDGADESADESADEARDAVGSDEVPDTSKSGDGDPAEESATPAASGGGFNWGLTPTNAATPTPPVSPVPPAPSIAPEPPAEPSAELPARPEPVQSEPVQPEPVQSEPVQPEPAQPEPVQPPELLQQPGFTPPPAPVVPPQVSSFAPPPLVQPEPVPLVEPPLPVTSVFAPPPLVAPPVIPPVIPPDTASGEPLPFDAALAGGPSSEAEPPTRALPWEGPATELFSPPVASAPVAEPATELLGGFGPGDADAAAGSSAEGSSVDALFGESQFREYQTGSLAAAVLPAKPEPARAPRAPVPHSQKVLLWIAGGLAALLVLIGLFFLGTKLPRASSAPVVAPTPTASAKSTPSPTPTVLPVGPLAAGSYKWDRLLGGECLSPFTSPWAEKFTVVDCGTPHPAQMVARGVFAETPPAANNESTPATPVAGGAVSSYPGADALQAQINLLCTTPSVIDFAAAGAYSDIQILGSYPATAEQWTDGDRSYFCFVTRSSGEPITGSLAVPKVA